MADKVGKECPPDYEIFFSDDNMEMDTENFVQETEQSFTESDTSDTYRNTVRNGRYTRHMWEDSDMSDSPNIKQSRRKQRKRLRFMSSVDTQTDSVFMIGRNVCITGPAVDQHIDNTYELDKLSTLVKSLTQQLKNNQKRVALLEKEVIEKQIELISQKMQTYSLQAAAEVNEQIIQDFSEKIILTAEELSRDSINRNS